MTHTPGPWVVLNDNHLCWPGIDSGSGTSIVIIGSDVEDDDGGVRGRTAQEALANAHLIASAPVMLNILQRIQPYDLPPELTKELWAFFDNFRGSTP